PTGRAAAADLARRGFELGNHSDTHPYDLARLDRARIRDEIARAHARIAEAAGAAHAPVGFRAPGYELSPSVVDVLVELDYRYDSSIFPSPPYYLAKAAVMGTMALRGRSSASVLGTPRVLAAPADPYHPDPRAPWRRGDAALVELPIAVVPWIRVPVIGTSLLL